MVYLLGYWLGEQGITVFIPSRSKRLILFSKIVQTHPVTYPATYPVDIGGHIPSRIKQPESNGDGSVP
jgi:hypothetical protein